MFALFVLATGQAWLRGLDISCGCFDFGVFGGGGAASRFTAFLESPGAALARNLGLTAVTAFLIRGQLRERNAAPA